MLPQRRATARRRSDRITAQRFREAFPRARWSDRLNAWFVPGRTAEKRIGRWLADMEAEAEAFADEKGKDAFSFDPIESRYLDAGPSSLQIRTPYSRTIIHEIREIPFARWDADRRIWTVPNRSFDEFRRRWPAIEEAAQRMNRSCGRHDVKRSTAPKKARCRRSEQESAGGSGTLSGK